MLSTGGAKFLYTAKIYQVSKLDLYDGYCVHHDMYVE